MEASALVLYNLMAMEFGTTLWWIVLGFMSVVGFVAAWNRLGDPQGAQGKTEAVQKFYEMELKEGMNGKLYLKPPPPFLRFTLSLLSALSSALMTGYLWKWLSAL